MRKKLKNQNGLSITLALLLLLLSAFVASSVVMAASANVGKTRSNREEQQKYLSLSSAMQLVCDDLKGTTYKGHYLIKRCETAPDPLAGGDPGDTVVTFKCVQERGLYEGGSFSDLFLLELDSIYRDLFRPAVAAQTGDGFFLPEASDPDSNLSVRTPAAHELKLEVSGDDVPKELKGKRVTVKVEFDRSRSQFCDLIVTASVPGEDRYRLQAVLMSSCSTDVFIKSKPDSTTTPDELFYQVKWTMGEVKRI